MHLLLRTQNHQAKIEGQLPVHNSDEDFAVVVDGPVIGRIFREVATDQGRWCWILHYPVVVNGMAATLDEAMDEIAKRWHLASGKVS